MLKTLATLGLVFNLMVPALATEATPATDPEGLAAPPADASVAPAGDEAPSNAGEATGAQPTAEDTEPLDAAGPDESAADGSAAAEADVDDPMVDLFVAKCASCHTVGKGDRVGPDLAGVHSRRDAAWLATFVKTPSKLLDSDAAAREMLAKYNNVRMPDLGLTDDQVEGLISLVTRCSGEPCNLVGKFVAVTAATDADIARGQALFVGTEAIKSGAVPCVSCHTVAGLETSVPGGTLAKDLTHAFARLGDEGLDAALKNPSFALMNKVFSDRPLEKDEAFALRAFLYASNRSEKEAADQWSVLLTSLIGSAFVMVVLNGFWSRRLRGVRSSVARRREKRQ